MGFYIISDQGGSFSIDFIFSVMILLIVICGVFVIAEERLGTAKQASQSIQMRVLSDKIANALDESYSGGEGQEVKLEMPSSINGDDYTVKINQSGVLVKSGGKNGYSFSYFKRISNFVMDKNEVFMFPNTNYTIRNVKNGNNYHFVIVF